MDVDIGFVDFVLGLILKIAPVSIAPDFGDGDNVEYHHLPLNNFLSFLVHLTVFEYARADVKVDLIPDA